MHWIDWTIVAGFVLFLTILSFYTKRYTKSVADFLVANRCAGRYLLTISQEMTGLGAITFVAMFEMFYRSGFCASWWWIIKSPIFMILTVSGWVIYRYRETRAMTMAQFFEERYSKKFRVFCGIIAWTTGVINMGIFPAVTARFFMYFCGLPETFNFLGIQFSTFVSIMFFEISVALLYTFFGGMIVIIVTDFFQGIFCLIVFVVVLATLLLSFTWDQISNALVTAPENASLINPFKTSHAEGFNFGFFMMQIFVGVYAYQAWQGGQGYMAAAKNAHEAKMSRIIGSWRQLIHVLLMMLLPICVYVVMHNTDFASQANESQNSVNTINDKTIHQQMLVPIAISKILPVGVLGLFVSVMLAAAISTDDTYLHSWGSIFVQDIILPFRKKVLSRKQHIWALRISIFFVAVFIFCFSLLFKQNDFILMYINLTGALYIGGAGAVLVGGLYWNRGSTLGAWLAMIIGGTVAFSGLVLQQCWSNVIPFLVEYFPNIEFFAKHNEQFPYNGMQVNIFAINCAIIAYVIGSLYSWIVKKIAPHNMNKMLHRGKYSIKGEHKKDVQLPPTGIKALLPTEEFTFWDRFLYYSLTTWSLAWFLFLVIVTIYHFTIGTTDAWWLKYWHFYLWLTMILGLITTVWFLWGGLKDFFDMFKTLKAALHKIDDDGRVMPDELITAKPSHAESEKTLK